MITETKEVYKCEYCRKLYQRKTACENHEPKCKKNPINSRICFGCNFIEKRELTHYYDHPYSSGEQKVKVLFCNKLNIALLPPHVPAIFEFDEVGQEEMKKECVEFKEIEY